MKQKIYFFILALSFHITAICGYADISPNQTILIPMKDGTMLPTDIYLPSENAKNLPCILIRSPSGRKANSAVVYAPMAMLGYVVAIQETRSALDPEGKVFPYLSDSWLTQNDGQETILWLANHPLTNGKIGTVGFSALGITQLLLAPSAPEQLKCQFVGTAPASLFHYGIYPSGVLLKNQVEAWLGFYAKDSGVVSFVANQQFNEEFWDHFDTRKGAHEVKVPAIHQGGWYDTFLQGTIDAFLARQNEGGEGAKGQQKLLIGPWIHFWPTTIKLGDFEVPLAGRVPPHDITPQRWFDFYLKGNDNGIDKIPAVTYYVMGPFDGTPSKGNVWKTSDVWPIEAKEIPFYLSKNGKLIEEHVPHSKSFTNYIHDPLNSVPTLGGLNLFLEAGPKDQRPIEKRKDVLTFTTPHLKEDVEVTGRINAKLFISSDRPDTSVAVRLCDVYPDGRSILIADGIYRTGLLPFITQTEGVKVKQPMEVNVDLWSTSMVFAKGHRIRISISGSNYPRYENNWNIGVFRANLGGSAIAKNKVFMGGIFPSKIVLPIVR